MRQHLRHGNPRQSQAQTASYGVNSARLAIRLQPAVKGRIEYSGNHGV
jgi:hypothetical protein